MLDYTYIEKYNINYLRASDPFILQELLMLLQAPHDVDDPATRNGPVIMDFRQVNIERVEMHDIRRHLIKKGDLDGVHLDFFCAYVVGSPEAVSKLRVANIFSALTGVSTEDKAFVTEDFTEAVTWISEIVQADKFSVYQELEAMALIAEQRPPYGTS